MKFILFIGWFGFLIFFVLPLLFSFFRKSVPQKNSLEKGSDMVRDPVCGVYIPKDRAESLKSKGTIHYFCGKECQSKFIAGGA
jgi:uncharacterized protein